MAIRPQNFIIKINMYTVILDTENKRLGYEMFEKEFINICNRHREENRALVFAFILYNFENPQLNKVLSDSDYWLSLNQISGNYLTVFSLHYKSDTIKEMMMQKMNHNANKEMFEASGNFNPTLDTNNLIRKYFGDDFKIKYPSVLFFQTDNTGVADSRIIQLDEQNIENAFLELKLYIQTAATALENVNRENKNNRAELFDLVEMNVKSLRSGIVTKRGIKKITSIAELASTISGLNV
jgi:hypothetical protein